MISSKPPWHITSRPVANDLLLTSNFVFVGYNRMLLGYVLDVYSLDIYINVSEQTFSKSPRRPTPRIDRIKFQSSVACWGYFSVPWPLWTNLQGVSQWSCTAPAWGIWRTIYTYTPHSTRSLPAFNLDAPRVRKRTFIMDWNLYEPK